MGEDYVKRLRYLMETFQPLIEANRVTNRELMDLSFNYIANMYAAYLKAEPTKKGHHQFARHDLEKKLRLLLDHMETL